MIVYVTGVQRDGDLPFFTVHTSKEEAAVWYETTYELMPLSVRASLAVYEVDLDYARLLASETT